MLDRRRDPGTVRRLSGAFLLCLAACQSPARSAAVPEPAVAAVDGGSLPVSPGTDVPPTPPPDGSSPLERDAAVDLGAIDVAADLEPEPPPAREPATDSAREVIASLQRIEQTLTETRYQYQTVVRESRGVYKWDCSGMVAWVLERAAPVALEALGADRPLARDFYDTIAESPTDAPRRGWLRLEGPEALAPGDVFAWRKPDFWADHPNTGHVGFLMEAPRPHPYADGVWVVRIADATRMLHEADSRPVDGEGGYGTGTVVFEFDDAGAAVAYGWYGVAQDPATYVPTPIAFGRVSR